MCTLSHCLIVHFPPVSTFISTFLHFVGLQLSKQRIDRIEYDVTRLKYLTYKMASVRMPACVRVCAIEMKPGMLRAACCVLRASMMYAFGRANGLPYKMATFHSKKGLFNTVYWVCENSDSKRNENAKRSSHLKDRVPSQPTEGSKLQ